MDKDMFRDMATYESARAFVNFLHKPKQRNWLDTFSEHMNSIALYDDSRIASNEASQKTISNLHELVSVLAKYESSVDPEFLLITLLEASKFIVPSATEIGETNTSVSTSGRTVETILGGAILPKDLFALLETPIHDDSIILKKVGVSVCFSLWVLTLVLYVIQAAAIAVAPIDNR